MNTLRLIAVFFRIGVLGETAYRANFWFQLLESMLSLGTALAAIAVVFSQTATLGGWNAAELSALIGVYFLVLGTTNLVVAPSLTKFMEDVVQGSLDYTLTKPADAQLLVSFAEIRVWKLIDVVLGAGVLIAALSIHTAEVGPIDMLAFAVTLACGAVIVYSFCLSLATLAFWFVRVENLLQIFWSMYAAGRWPVGIYPGWLKWILTIVVPIAFAVTVPAEAVAGRLGASTLIGAIALALALLAFSRWFWKRGLERYSGASA